MAQQKPGQPVQKRRRRRPACLPKFRKALEGRKASRQARLQWVEQNRLLDLKKIDPTEPPDMAAVDLWLLAQDDEWWKAVFKAHSTSDTKTGGGDVADDGRMLVLLESLQKEVPVD